jgi:tRNA-specific 2-thiouridylase
VKNKSTVAVAMSGGVDSSVAAALLKEQGYSVFGVTMIHVDYERAVGSYVKDAQAVCDRLGITLHVLEIRDRFKELVIETFLQEYISGRTPNPCTICNPTVKWGILLEFALQNGAEKFATGHYARILYQPEKSEYQLLKAIIEKKDQSYALWRLNQQQLARTLFPLGELAKTEVREIAAALELPVAQKKESQEICFITDDDYHRFIKEMVPQASLQIQPGLILDQDGLIVGEHQGTAFYTVGQRKGLGIALGRPVFVTEIDHQKNIIVIGDKRHLLSKGLVANHTHWISNHEPMEGTVIEARIRYKDPGYPAIIDRVEKDSVTVVFDEPRSAVTPGQSAVFYQQARLIGGGVIMSALK